KRRTSAEVSAEALQRSKLFGIRVVRGRQWIRCFSCKDKSKARSRRFPLDPQWRKDVDHECRVLRCLYYVCSGGRSSIQLLSCRWEITRIVDGCGRMQDGLERLFDTASAI